MRRSCGPLEAEIELQRPTDDVAHGVARVHRGVRHLIDHLDALQGLLVAILEGGGKGSPSNRISPLTAAEGR